MKIDKNWWKHFFNDIYLITDSRSISDKTVTNKEVNIIENLLTLDKKDRILDLCGGQGRHSLELAKRGYRDLTVLDYSAYLISLGRRTAKKTGLRIKFKQKDARSTGLKDNNYSVIFIMANSFGYFYDDKENRRILKEIYRLLKKNGRMLLDLSDSEYIKNNLKPISWHQADKDIMVLRQRQLDGDLIKAREIVISKKRGLLRDGFYCERLYNKQKISNLLKNIGFENINIKNNLSIHERAKEYGFLTSRMFVTAKKG